MILPPAVKRLAIQKRERVKIFKEPLLWTVKFTRDFVGDLRHESKASRSLEIPTMKFITLLYPALLTLFLSTPLLAARAPANSILLSTVKTLTLRDGLKTSHRRVPAVPQVCSTLALSIPQIMNNTNPRIAEMRRRLRQRTLHNRRPTLQKPRLRLRRREHPMDMHRLPARRIQTRFHRRDLRGV